MKYQNPEIYSGITNQYTFNQRPSLLFKNYKDILVISVQ